MKRKSIRAQFEARSVPANDKGSGMALFGFDVYSPPEIAERVRDVGVAKAELPVMTVAMLGLLAGAFIAIGSLFYTLVAADTTLGFAATRVAGGVVFSVGLVLVVVAGGELFTGNNLLAMAWAEKRVSTASLLRNWSIALLANALGAAGMAVLVSLTPYPSLNAGGVGETAVRIAAYKTSLPLVQAFFAGVLCNVLVCMAVWLSLAGRTVVDKVVAIVLPISAFVAAGFEHCVANMYFIPLGILLRDTVDVAAIAGIERLDWWGYLHNLVPVTLGNVVGGSGLVALVYHLVYRPGRTAAGSSEELETGRSRYGSR
jgi:formate/nitrite transporter